MSRKSVRGAVLAVMVLWLGAVGSPAVAGEGPMLEGGWWAAVTAWVDQALGSSGLQPIFQESRCAIDPNGQPLPCAGAEADSHCGIDPNGRPLPCAGAEVDSRCAIDPDGQPVCASL